MSYVKAADVMPQELIEKIQEYVNGVYIYIPRKEDEKKSWGETTSTRQELIGRNQQIYKEHKQGQPTRELADRYCLSVKSIQKIIRTERKRLSEPVPSITKAAACVWEIVPDALPKIIRNCPKCGHSSHFINTEKFRINANKSLLDIWLIYQCETCKSTWNMTLAERVDARQVDAGIYSLCQINDSSFARTCGLDRSLMARNGVQADWSGVTYSIAGPGLLPAQRELTIRNPCGLELRMDKLLSGKSGISRSAVSKAIQDGRIRQSNGSPLPKKTTASELSIFLCSFFDTRIS